MFHTIGCIISFNFYSTSSLCACFCRHGTHAATTAAATARLSNGSCHAAKHAGHDGNEFWGTNALWSHAYAGELVCL